MARVSCKGHSTNRKALPSATPSRHTTKPLSPSLARSPDFFFAESQVSTRQSFAECLKNSTWQRGLCRHIVCHVRLGGTRQSLCRVFFLYFFFSQLQMFSRRISRDLPRGTGRATPWMPRPARMVLLIERRGDCARLSRVSALMSNLRSLLGVETAVSRHQEVEQLY